MSDSCRLSRRAKVAAAKRTDQGRLVAAHKRIRELEVQLANHEAQMGPVEQEVEARFSMARPSLTRLVSAGQGGTSASMPGDLRASRNYALHADLGCGSEGLPKTAQETKRRCRGGRRKKALQCDTPVVCLSDDSVGSANCSETFVPASCSETAGVLAGQCEHGDVDLETQQPFDGQGVDPTLVDSTCSFNRHFQQALKAASDTVEYPTMSDAQVAVIAERVAATVTEIVSGNMMQQPWPPLVAPGLWSPLNPTAPAFFSAFPAMQGTSVINEPSALFTAPGIWSAPNADAPSFVPNGLACEVSAGPIDSKGRDGDFGALPIAHPDIADCQLGSSSATHADHGPDFYCISEACESSVQTVFTYSAATCACDKGGQWLQSFSLLSTVRSVFLEPHYLHLNSLFSCVYMFFGAAGAGKCKQFLMCLDLLVS